MTEHVICSLGMSRPFIYGSQRRVYLVMYECNTSTDGLTICDWTITWVLPCGYAWALIAKSGLLI